MDIRRRQTATQTISRRRFIGTSAAAAGWILLPTGLSGSSPKHDFKGVRIGAISYSFRELPAGAEQILGYLVKLGLPTIELMGAPAEAFAGAPEAPPRPRRRPSEMNEEERAVFQETRRKYAEEARTWRLSASMESYKRLRKMYNDEGVEIDILKLGSPQWSDAEIDYAFNAARAVGARGISLEISDEAGKRMGAFASKHKMLVGMHNHTQVGEEGFSFEPPLSYSSYNMLNLDVGHYVAGTDASPVPVIRKYHHRISHLHLKDRKKGTNGGDNVSWGAGDTPLREVLQLLKAEKYPITAMIELEYPIPSDSDVMAEMAKCVEFCRESLA